MATNTGFVQTTKESGVTRVQNVVLHVVEVSGGGTTSTRAVCRATTKTCTMI
jgi:hypothetical protein